MIELLLFFVMLLNIILLILIIYYIFNINIIDNIADNIEHQEFFIILLKLFLVKLLLF